MPGEAEPIYIAARRGLLDALDALAGQRDAFVLVGAQAIYLHTGAGDLAVAPYTTDADLALDPRALSDRPPLEQMLQRAGLYLDERSGYVGAWLADVGEYQIPIDLLVPEALEPKGGRAAKLGEHGRRTARRARGLEAALVDRERMTIGALDPADARRHEIWVAGPAALVVAKLHKVGERLGDAGRQRDKDALDLLRLLRAMPAPALAARLQALAMDTLSQETAMQALAILKDHFTQPQGAGSQMAARAAAPLEDEDEIAMACAFLAADLLEAYDRNRPDLS